MRFFYFPYPFSGSRSKFSLTFLNAYYYLRLVMYSTITCTSTISSSLLPSIIHTICIFKFIIRILKLDSTYCSNNFDLQFMFLSYILVFLTTKYPSNVSNKVSNEIIVFCIQYEINLY